MNQIISMTGAAILAMMALYLLVLLLAQLRQAVYVAGFHRREIESLTEQAERRLAALDAAACETGQAWQGARKFIVQGKVLEADSVCSFYLAPHDGQPLPAFQPGQFLTFQLHIPGRSRPDIRCYSLSDGPSHEDYYRVTIKRLAPPRDKPEAPSGLSSSYFHDQVRVGDILDVKSPGGNFYLDRSHDHPVVLIGGGIGITPVLSMLNTIVDSGSGREVWFYYGVRNADEHVMKAYLKELGERDNIHLRVCYSDPGEDDVLGEDFDVNGRVSVDLFKQELPSSNFDFYICGPAPMMTSITTGLEDWGVPAASIHYEAFGPATVKKADAVVSEGVEVTFARSDKTVVWTGEHPNLLAFGEANGVPLSSGCKAGTNCGGCTTALREGKVDYVGSPNVSGVEKGSCLTCCAVPKGPVTLDA